MISIPLGVGGAIYLSEYARDTKLTRSIRLALVNLAGIPSVVYGLFGLGMFVIFLGFGTSILAGALTLAIMTLPVMISAAEEALRAVPMEFRTVSASLGGTRWQGVSRIVLPQALPGIITGVILGLLRAMGETAPILFTVAAFYLPQLPRSVFDQTMALPYHLYVISTQVPGMPPKMQYGTALVLLVFVLSLNILATVIRSYFRRRQAVVERGGWSGERWSERRMTNSIESTNGSGAIRTDASRTTYHVSREYFHARSQNPNRPRQLPVR